MSNRKSNQNICDFYKDKSRDALTLKYFDKWYKNNKFHNEYFELYKNFCGKSFSCKDNESLYRVIEAWENIERAKFPIEIFGKNEKYIRTIRRPSEMPDLDFLKNIDIDLLNPCQNQGGNANQKWHLFVGIFAYSVVCKSESPFDWEGTFYKYSCLVLRLWMIENAENRKDLTDIETAINNDNLKHTSELINKAFNALLMKDNLCI